MPILSLILTFVFGAIIGSFLNAFALRYDQGISLRSRSQCPKCHQQLSWGELIPIISFLRQHGKCRRCQAKISPRYFIVELGTGLVFALLFHHFFSPDYLFHLWELIAFSFSIILFSTLIVLALYDLKNFAFPSGLLYLFLILSVLGLYFLDIDGFSSQRIFEGLIGALIAVPFLLISYFSRERMIGYGDGLLLLGIGAILGLLHGLFAVAFASWIALAIYICIKIFMKKEIVMNGEIPFGIFLALGCFIAFLFL